MIPPQPLRALFVLCSVLAVRAAASPVPVDHCGSSVVSDFIARFDGARLTIRFAATNSTSRTLKSKRATDLCSPTAMRLMDRRVSTLVLKAESLSRVASTPQ